MEIMNLTNAVLALVVIAASITLKVFGLRALDQGNVRGALRCLGGSLPLTLFAAYLVFWKV